MNHEKQKIYLDLSKCSEGEIKEVGDMLSKENVFYYTNLLDTERPVLHYGFSEGKYGWLSGTRNGDAYLAKTKLSFTAFKEMLASGEEGNNGWISTEIKPDAFQDVILYREDAGVFMGYYGNLAETLSENTVDKLYEDGVSEETMWEKQFFYYGMEGNGILEGNEKPTHWMPLPEPPKF